MRPGFVPATPCSMATMGARSSDMPSSSAAWDITLTNISGSKAASLPSDLTADMSGGSMVSTNGIPQFATPLRISIRYRSEISYQVDFGIFDSVLYPA